MNSTGRVSRREFVAGGAAAALSLAGAAGVRQASCNEPPQLISRIPDQDIRRGFQAALEKTILPAAVETAYPGHFWITANGQSYGGDSTWPGLDSWQLAGAYLLLGRERMVLDHFDFVQASQRADGNIPFAIFPGEQAPDRSSYLRGLRHPEDVFTYKPGERADRPPHTNLEARKWVGLYTHWQPMANPLRTLGVVSYVLTAAEIFRASRDIEWLRRKLPSIDRAAQWLTGQHGDGGLIYASGFYTELPPRWGADGVTQCYAVHAYRQLANLYTAAEIPSDAARWSRTADALAKAFHSAFWRDGHFAEYIHRERGLVDSHGLSDVNFAAIAFGLASDDEARALWPKLTREQAFWRGGMPTQTVTKPFSYESWELHEKLPFQPTSPLQDVAAMGRVWFLEANACIRMKDNRRLSGSVRNVCRAGLASDGLWHERYHPTPDGGVRPAGARGYGEYPVILARIVLGNPAVFAP